MNQKHKEAIAAREIAVRKMTELRAKAELTDDETVSLKGYIKEVTDLGATIKGCEELEAELKTADDMIVASKRVNPDDRPSNFGGNGSGDAPILLNYTVPAVLKCRTPKKLMAAPSLKGNIELAQKGAYGLTQFMQATILKHQPAIDWCQKNGYLKAQQENINQYGGFLVPTPLAGFIIELMEQFGVARKTFHNVQMGADTLTIPRRAGTLTGYWLTDGQAITASTKQWDAIQLVVNKLAAFAYISNELAEDAMINVGDDLGQELAWLFSALEDEAAFLGDGTSKYGGFFGICPALIKAWTVSGGAGLIVGDASTGAAWSNYTLPTFNNVQAALPDFAWKRGEPVWIMSRQFYNAVPVKLMAAAGGNTIQTIAQGPDDNPRFLGSPVVFSQIMPNTGGTDSQVDAIFGNIALGAEFGDRRALAVAQSTEFAFSTDQVAVRGIERLALNVHDVGGTNLASLATNPTNTTSAAGPIVGLISASS